MRALPAVLLLAGCISGPRPEAQSEDAGEVAPDPLGVYDLTMSSQSRVSRGTVEIRGGPRKYHGSLVLGTAAVVLESVEASAGMIHIRARMTPGSLVLRLAGDGRCFSGNWVLGMQRGTVVAEKRVVSEQDLAPC